MCNEYEASILILITQELHKIFFCMSKTKTSTYDQDTFDKAFINAIHELQKIGFCKNVAQLEEYLEIPKRTLYEVLKGRRGVPLLHRFKLQNFIVSTYQVNPKYFTNLVAPLWKGESPTLEEVEEPFDTKSRFPNVITMGDVVELERLRMENQGLKDRVKQLEKDLKAWRELALKAAPNSGATPQKSGPKTGQKGKK